MDTNRLRYFCAIAETGSVRRAAEILHVSPPALSKATRLLEEELGVKLVIRSGRNIQLTDEGRRLVKRGKDVLRELELLRAEIESRPRGVREVKIATFEVFSTYFLKSLSQIGWEDVPLVLHEVLPGELEKALVDRQVDIGITYMPVPMAELDYLKVTTIEMGVYTAKSAFPNVPQPELPFVVPVMPITGSPSRIRGLDGWPEDAYPRKVKYQVTLMESALQLCRQGRAAGYFPAFIVNAHNSEVRDPFQLVRRNSPYKGRICMTDVYIVKRKSDVENAAIRQLAKAIRLFCGPKRANA